MTSPLSKRIKLSMETDQSWTETVYDDNLRKIVCRCTLCNKSCDTLDQLDIHKRSKAHIKKLNTVNVDKLNSNIQVISITEKFDSMNSPILANNMQGCNYFCQVCNLSCNTKEQLDLHNNGKGHQKKALKNEFKYFNNSSEPLSNISSGVSAEVIVQENTSIPKENDIPSINKAENPIPHELPPAIKQLLMPKRDGAWITCALCHLSMNTEEQYSVHCSGSKHTKRLKAYNVPCEEIPSSNNNDELVNCVVCNIKIHKNNVESHDKGKMHKDKLVKSSTGESFENSVIKTGFPCELENLNALKLKPRKYQQEIYEKSIMKDCVVFLPTGTGKTFIGAMLILKMLEVNPFHRVAFLVDKVLLVMQQHSFLKEQFEDVVLTRFQSQNDTASRKLKLIALANEFIDTEYNCSIRDHDVIVATADLFKNILHKKQMYWTDFSLVMLDEAHHCVKEHPYNKLLCEFHLYPLHIRVDKTSVFSPDMKSPPEVESSSHEEWKIKRCKIIGLTASPAGDSDLDMTYKLLETLLSDLGDVDIVNVTDNIDELNEYTSMTNIESKIVKYESDEIQLRNLVSNHFIFLLKKFERDVNGIGKEVNLGSNSLSIEAVNNLKKKLTAFLTDVESLQKAILNHILSLVDILDAIDNIGFAIAKEKFSNLIENENEKVWYCNNIIHFKDSIDKLEESFVNDEIKSSSFITAIVEECQSLTGENRTILILVKERKIARLYLESLKKEISNFECHLLVGHGARGTKDRSKGMSVLKQKKALDFIREKKSQIVIATSVADEGIDLPECDLVIIVNPPNSVQALVQIRGRARKKTSRLLMLCRDQQCIDSLEELKIKEKNIQLSISKLIENKITSR